MVYKIKKIFLNDVVDFNKNILKIQDIWGKFDTLLQHLNINLQDVIQVANIKNQKRGAFTKNIFMEYLLIPKTNQTILNKYFFSSNSIYEGTVIYNTTYYKFFTYKAIRDDIPGMLLITNEKELHNVPIADNLIAKVVILDNLLFQEALKRKLIEETKEVIDSDSFQELQEELADVYTVLKQISIV